MGKRVDLARGAGLLALIGGVGIAGLTARGMRANAPPSEPATEAVAPALELAPTRRATTTTPEATAEPPASRSCELRLRLRSEAEIPSAILAQVGQGGRQIGSGVFAGDTSVVSLLPCAPVDVVIESPPGLIRPVSLSLTPQPPPAEEAVIELLPPCGWWLRALAPDGSPLTDAIAPAHPMGEGPAAGPDGWIRMERCASGFGSGYVLAPGYLARRVSAPPDGDRVGVPLAPAAAVVGTLDCGGREDVGVFAWSLGGLRPCRREAGGWRCDVDPSRRISVSVHDLQETWPALGGVVVADPADGFALRCGDKAAGPPPPPPPSGPAALHLRLVDRSGRALAGGSGALLQPGSAVLWAGWRPLGRADASGWLPEALDVPEGMHRVYVSAPGHADRVIEVQLSREQPETRVVTLHPGAACTAGGLDPEAAPGALRWVEISSGAWTAGLRPADRLIEVGGAPFDPAAGPAALLIQPGESLDLLVERPGVGELDIDVPCPL